MSKPAAASIAQTLVFAIALLLVLALSGCATNASYPNNPKPPAVLTVSVLVGESDFAVSPKPFGAGPTRFIVTNQTGTTQSVTFSTAREDQRVTIDRDQNTLFQMNVEPGTLTISTSNTAAQPLDVTVGPTRVSAQQNQDQP